MIFETILKYSNGEEETLKTQYKGSPEEQMRNYEEHYFTKIKTMRFRSSETWITFEDGDAEAEMTHNLWNRANEPNYITIGGVRYQVVDGYSFWFSGDMFFYIDNMESDFCYKYDDEYIINNLTEDALKLIKGKQMFNKAKQPA